MAGACKDDEFGGKAFSGCKDFLNGSEKAAAQWELERRFSAFEAKLCRDPKNLLTSA